MTRVDELKKRGTPATIVNSRNEGNATTNLALQFFTHSFFLGWETNSLFMNNKKACRRTL